MGNKDKWIRQCKALPVGTRKRVVCCGSDRSRIIEHLPDRYVSNCFRSTCENYVEKKSGLARLTALHAKEVKQELKKNAIPHDTTYESSEFPMDAVAWLSKAGIHQDVWEKYRFGYTAKYHRVVVPIYQDGTKVGATLRALGDVVPKYIMTTDRKGRIFTTKGNVGQGTVICTEDILSAIRISEAYPEYDVCCILGTGVMLDRVLYLVSKYDHIHMWLDGDDAGVTATKKWVEKLSPYVKTSNTVIDGKDPKDFTDEEIIQILKKEML